eukprot:Hpha_TRINITY_DN18892_c0_g1::TRINITY_DN18892_c0_g1_i1::g.26412::m.26412
MGGRGEMSFADRKVVLSSLVSAMLGVFYGNWLSPTRQSTCPPFPQCPPCSQDVHPPPCMMQVPIQESGVQAHVDVNSYNRTAVSTGWRNHGRISWKSLAAKLVGQQYPLQQAEGARHSRIAEPRVLVLHEHRNLQNALEPRSGCTEWDVVYVTKRRSLCTALVETTLGERAPSAVDRFRQGNKGEFLSKNVNVKLSASSLRLYDRFSEGAPWFRHIQHGEGLVAQLYSQYQKVSSRVGPMIARQAKRPCKGCPGKGMIISMCTNAGNVRFVLNWLCSARAQGLRPNVVVFAADEVAQKRVEKAGIPAIYDPAFGEIPQDAAINYGDDVFAMMMWLKSLAVFIPVQLGYTTLFQDADLVWFRDPWPVISGMLKDGADTIWSDDGARSPRFAPYFANTGFYVIAGNSKGQMFVTDLMGMQGNIVSWGSQQSAVNMLLGEARSRYGMDIRMLPDTDFAGGVNFHHRRALVAGWLNGTQELPTMFHMCWTDNGNTKLRALDTIGWWLVKDTCGDASSEAASNWSPEECCYPGKHGTEYSSNRADAFWQLSSAMKVERDGINKWKATTEGTKRRARMKSNKLVSHEGYQCRPGQVMKVKAVHPANSGDSCLLKCKEHAWCTSFDFTTYPRHDSCRLAFANITRLGYKNAGNELREACDLT